MPQLNLYIDQTTLKKITSSARIENTSLSKWVKNKIESVLKTSWPLGYFDLFGSLRNVNLKRPRQIPYSKDAKRQSL